MVSARRSGRRRRSSGADPATSGKSATEPLAGAPDANERGGQVALDVDAEGLERGDVEDRQRRACRRAGLVSNVSTDHRNALSVADLSARPRARVDALIAVQAPWPAWRRDAANQVRVVAEALQRGHPVILPDATDNAPA